MRTPTALALALLCAAIASGADISLRDGRVLTNAVVLKQDASTVTVRHSGGFTQVEKAKLPDDLSAQYPVDEAAAAEQRFAERSRAATRKYQQSEQWREKQKAASNLMIAAQSSPAYKRSQAIRSTVGTFIQSRFRRTQWRRSATGWSFHPQRYTLADPIQEPGTLDRWTVEGSVDMDNGTKELMTAIVEEQRGLFRVVGYQTH